MPSYKYTLRDGKTTLWYVNFYYTDWVGAKKHICKRGFKTQREAKEYDVVCIEDLKVKNHKLAQSIADVSWAEFV